MSPPITPRPCQGLLTAARECLGAFFGPLTALTGLEMGPDTLRVRVHLLWVNVDTAHRAE